mgnify:CR=1 FL=1
MKVRSKRAVLFSFGIDYKAYVHVYPQQKWEAYFFEDEVHLSRKGVSMCIRRADFEKYFVECAERKAVQNE